MGILRTDTISGIGSDGPIFDGVTKFDTQGYVVPPTGTTDQRSAGITTAQGTIRFNTDSQKLEFYAQDQWWEMVIDTPNLAVSSNTGAGARGLFAGAYNNPAASRNTIDYVNIASTGNAIDFGDRTTDNTVIGLWSSCSSSTRGVFAGGYKPVGQSVNVIDYVTISSIGNAQDFGDLFTGRYSPGALSNATRGIFGGGGIPTTNTIDYITIASTGNAADFGDLTAARFYVSTVSSPVRGVFAGGLTNANVIDFISISTLGNAQDFGDLIATNSATTQGGCSNPIRGIFAANNNPVGNIIQYITIATTGNATDFGDLTQTRAAPAATANSTRAIFGGGGGAPGYVNTIDYVTIMTQGNAVDFGDRTVSGSHSAACSNAHGGL